MVWWILCAIPPEMDKVECRAYPAFWRRAGLTAVATAAEELSFLPFLNHFGSDCPKLAVND
jgi:hypothetical protein